MPLPAETTLLEGVVMEVAPLRLVAEGQGAPLVRGAANREQRVVARPYHLVGASSVDDVPDLRRHVTRRPAATPKHGLPGAQGRDHSWWCSGTRTETTTRSMSGRCTVSSMSWNASSAPNWAAEALAVSSCAVQTALSS